MLLSFMLLVILALLFLATIQFVSVLSYLLFLVVWSAFATMMLRAEGWLRVVTGSTSLRTKTRVK